MKKYILQVGLILVMACNFISMPVFCEEIISEDEYLEKERIMKGIKFFFDLLIDNDKEQIMRLISEDNVQFKNWTKKELENIQKLSNFSCGDPNVLNYKQLDPYHLTVEFTIECNGFDYDEFKDIKRVIAARLFLDKDENSDSWKIAGAEDINKAEDVIKSEEEINSQNTE